VSLEQYFEDEISYSAFFESDQISSVLKNLYKFEMKTYKIVKSQNLFTIFSAGPSYFGPTTRPTCSTLLGYTPLSVVAFFPHASFNTY